MSPVWLLPLGVGAAGAVALCGVARWLDREVARLQEALRPLRTSGPASAQRRRDARPR